MKRILNYKIYVLGVILIFSACDDDVNISDPNGIDEALFFTTSAQLASATTAVYAYLQTEGLYQRFAYILPDTFSDEMITSADSNFQPSWNYALTAAQSQTTRFWVACYNGIARCNYILDQEDRLKGMVASGEATDYDDAEVDRRMGEAHFMRGFFYFLLVKRYSAVPMPLVTQTSLEGVPKSPVADVWATIVSDFTSAAATLPDRATQQAGRATSGAAQGMLGKALLHTGDFAGAKTAFASPLLSSYSLLPAARYTENFSAANERNEESLFEVEFLLDGAGGQAQWAGNALGVAEMTFHSQEYAGWTNARPSQKMINEFEPGDPRLPLVISQNGETFGPANDQVQSNGPIWYKFSQLYEANATSPESNINARVLRYADVLLMQAEAEIQSGGSIAASLGFLNQTRDRFSLAQYGSAAMDALGYPVTTSDEVMTAIVHERMVELCGEQVRFDDLVRWNLDTQELAVDDNGNTRNYNSAVDRLMPIPQIEIDANINMTQADQNTGF